MVLVLLGENTGRGSTGTSAGTTSFPHIYK